MALSKQLADDRWVARGKGGSVRFEALGSLRVSRDGDDATPPGRVQRSLLALLLLNTNRPVSAETLIDAIWPDDRTGRATSKLHVAVHRLRGQLDDPLRLSLDTAGYRLRVAEGEFDVTDFYALASRLLVEDLPPDRTAAIASQALALWRGRAFEGVPELAADPEVARCEDRHRWVFEAWCEAELVRGRHSALVPELEARTAAEPLHERFTVLLMRALHAAGRSADALAAYERARLTLRDELGLDPGQELRTEQARVLADESPVGTVTTDPAAPAQLPPAVDLTGRNPEFATIGGPDERRLSVVTGTAGVGKTALALAWAHRHRDDFPDGQLFIDLRGYSDDPPVEPEAALETCLRSLGIANAQIPTDLAERAGLFRSLVAPRKMLIVLDNARSTDQVRPLLPGGPSCTVLVTSRDTLPGMVTRENARVVELHPLSQDAAVELLASLISPRAEDDPASLYEIARLCGHLPLALRVAAQQIVVRGDQPLAELLAEMVDEQRHLDLLDADDGPATDVRAVLWWSYESLAPEAARVFRLIGLLPGADADVPALACLCGLRRRDVRDHLQTLTRAHLVDRSPWGRYRQHDLLRAYAVEQAERFDRPEDRVAARARLLRFYGRSAAAAGSVLLPNDPYYQPPPVDGDDGEPLTFEGVDEAHSWLEGERQNALASLDVADFSEAAAVFALGHGFGHDLREHGHHEDGLRLHTRMLECACAVGDVEAELTARIALGNLRRRSGDLDGAEVDYRAAIELGERAGRPDRRAAALGNLGTVAFARGYVARAEAYFEEAVETFRGREASLALGVGLLYLGGTRYHLGDLAESERLFDECLALCDQVGLRNHRNDTLAALARTVSARRDPRRAAALASQARDHAQEMGEPIALARATAEYGRARMALGYRTSAHESLREALGIARRVGTVELTIDVFEAYVSSTAEEPVALAMHREAIAYAAGHGFRGFEARFRAGLADVLERDGDRDGAVVELQRAAAIYDELEDPRAETLAARLRSVEVPAPRRGEREPATEAPRP